VGAEAVVGDLNSLEAIQRGLEGCDVVFHSAAKVEMWGDWNEFVKVNVDGTTNIINCATANPTVRRFVHVSTEAVLVGEPIVDVDETRPISPNIYGMYPRSKALAEGVVLKGYKPLPKEQVPVSWEGYLETVIIRPRFIWGKGDTTLLPKLVHAVRTGVFKWFSGGEYLTSTCHVDNVVEGALLAAERGVPGDIYFLTDGEPQIVKDFYARLISTQGIETDQIGSLPLWVAKIAAWSCETLWYYAPLHGEPPLVPAILALIGEQVTVKDKKAREALGYTAHKKIDEGMQELEQDFKKQQESVSYSSPTNQ